MHPSLYFHISFSIHTISMNFCDFVLGKMQSQRCLCSLVEVSSICVITVCCVSHTDMTVPSGNWWCWTVLYKLDILLLLLLSILLWRTRDSQQRKMVNSDTCPVCRVWHWRVIIVMMIIIIELPWSFWKVKLCLLYLYQCMLDVSRLTGTWAGRSRASSHRWRRWRTCCDYRLTSRWTSSAPFGRKLLLLWHLWQVGSSVFRKFLHLCYLRVLMRFLGAAMAVFVLSCYSLGNCQSVS